MSSRTDLKAWFSDFKQPTGAQFANLIDSFLHNVEDSIGIDKITGLSTILGNKADASSTATAIASKADAATTAAAIAAKADTSYVDAADAVLLALVNDATEAIADKADLSYVDAADAALQSIIDSFGDDFVTTSALLNDQAIYGTKIINSDWVWNAYQFYAAAHGGAPINNRLMTIGYDGRLVGAGAGASGGASFYDACLRIGDYLVSSGNSALQVNTNTKGIMFTPMGKADREAINLAPYGPTLYSDCLMAMQGDGAKGLYVYIDPIGWMQFSMKNPAAMSGVVHFNIDAIYGTTASPITGDIAAGYVDAVRGTKVIVIHNDGAEPAYPAEFQKRSASGNYVTDENNYITCEFLNSGVVIYSIEQAA